VNFSFLPGEVKFYDYFEQASANLMDCAQLLMHLLEDTTNLDEQVAAILEAEHRGDGIVHEVTNLLPRTLITPFDPDEMLRLVSSIDDSVDAIEEVANHMKIYRLTEVTEPARQLGSLIIEAARELDQAVHGMRDKKLYEQVRLHVVEVNTLEERADSVQHDALTALVEKHGDFLEFISWKEVYELLEATTDRIEDAGDVIQRVMIANA
jgi:predicted phosphate transport protein (TIGR00153 family)